MLQVILYAKNFKAEATDDRPADKPMIAVAESISIVKGGSRLLLEQPPEGARLPFVNLNDYALVFSQKVGVPFVVREGMMEATLFLSSGVRVARLFCREAPTDEEGNVSIVMDDDSALQVVHMDPDSLSTISLTAPVSQERADQVNAETDASFRKAKEAAE